MSPYRHGHRRGRRMADRLTRRARSLVPVPLAARSDLPERPSVPAPRAVEVIPGAGR